MNNCRRIAKEGLKYVIPERRKIWIRCCQKAKDSERQFDIISYVLQIIKGLDTNEDCLSILNNIEQENDRLVVENFVVAFSPLGYELVKKSPSYKSSLDRMKHIDSIYKRNQEFKSQIKRVKTKIA